MQGVLFRYGIQPSQIAFQSGGHRRHLILIGGLTDGLLSLPYAPALATALDNRGWSLVQAQISSSYQGYGVGSLDRDAKELRDLAVHLKEERSCEEVAVMGHSTGCQDTVRLVQRHGKDEALPKLTGVILQAATSDQEYYETLPATKEHIAVALEMQAGGKGQEILPRDFDDDGTPMSADRYLSLAQRRGDDDMFSSYLTDAELKDLLGHMETVRCRMLVSGSDEYIPEHVDKDQLAKRLTKAMGPLATYRIIEGAVHDACDHSEVVIQETLGFLN